MAERDRITYLFRKIILDVGLVTFACAVDRSAWNELVVGDIAKEFGEPIEFCFLGCMEIIVKTIRFRKPNEKVLLFIDQGTKISLEIWAELYRSQVDKFPEIEDIAFAPVPKVVALQGADMVATETYQYAQECINNPTNPMPNPHFKEFMTRELSCGLLLKREHIEEMIYRWKNSP